jgi:class 3 adenylate cyclase
MAMLALRGPSWGAPKPSVGPRCQFCRRPASPEQKYCGACGAILSPGCERKQATVLFIDVCGFTAISERLDPEDVRNMMDQVFDVILDVVHDHDGTVNQFLGDGVMALFFSEVHDLANHAVRALRAAVSVEARLAHVSAAIRRLHGVDLRVRAGADTGTVTMGIIGRGLRNDYVSPGQVVNVAARLLGLVAAGSIAVTSRTRELAQGAFYFDDLGDVSAAGVHAWVLTSKSTELSASSGVTAI